MSGIIKQLKEKFWWENYLVRVHDLEKFDEFKKFPQIELYKNIYCIIPTSEMKNISYEKILDRDFSITFWDEIWTEYTKDYRRYEFMFGNGWGKIAYTVYKKIKWYENMYSKFIDLFSKYMKEYDDFDMAWHMAFDEIMKIEAK